MDSDITRCQNNECGKRIKCYRYMTKPDDGTETLTEPWQGYSRFIPSKTGKCKYFMKIEKTVEDELVWQSMDGNKEKISKMTKDHIENCVLWLSVKVLEQSVLLLGYKNNPTITEMLKYRKNTLVKKIEMLSDALERLERRCDEP